MPKIQEKQKKEVVKQVYTGKDFYPLEAELEKYKIDIPTYPGNNGVPYFGVEGQWNFLVDKGALSKQRYMGTWTVADGELYQELRDLLDQYSYWCRRREYAIKMQGKDYEQEVEQLKGQMSIVDDIPF